ncbi:MAG: 3-hydroxyacyl-CoA dehydrogenase [Frankiales bacterium]|nr:3-hydroxyacyl-CoA dehydrogenase [Frankiales bacterium]
MTALPALERPAVPLRLVPAPASAPPYDDEPNAPVLRLVRSAPVEPRPVDDDAWLAGERTATAALPASHLFARHLVQGVLEVVSGVRAIKQLRRDTSPELYASLVELMEERPMPYGTRPGLQAIKGLHVQERPEGIVEACATVVRGNRFGALALRLEGFEGRWRCTELLGL